MIITRNWLDKHLNLSKVTNAQISVALNSLGFEVEHEVDYQAKNKDVIIGYVKTHHPIEGTQLSVNEVQISKVKTVQIVCGAENVQEGQYVLVAQIGATIANGMTMTTKKIQGYESQGMICSLAELGFTDTQLSTEEKDQIYVIKNYPIKNLDELIGHSINVLGFDDYSWEVDLTLNRSDGLSAFQMAKEIGNYFKVSVKNVGKVKSQLLVKHKLNLNVDKKLQKKVASLGYSAFSLKKNEFFLTANDDLFLKMSESKTTQLPIYDLANKVALESGQPVIFLDGDKLSHLTVALSQVNDQELVVLQTGDQLVSVLGQMPLREFRVGVNTKRVLVVYINLDQSLMRAQQKKLNLNNVSLQRYMKPLSPNKLAFTNDVLGKMFLEYDLLASISEPVYVVGPVKMNTRISVSLPELNAFLGTELTSKTVLGLFKHLGFKVTSKNQTLSFIIDPNRIDLEGPHDIAEEVARLYGYDKIPTTPLEIIANPLPSNLGLKLQNKVTDYLIGLGFTNIKTYSLINGEVNAMWNTFGLKGPIKLLSPLSNIRQEYRLSLASSMVETIDDNLAHGNKQLKLFEVGDVYYSKNQKATHLMIGLNGKFDYYDLKQEADAIFNFYNLDPLDVQFNLQPKLPDQIHPFINAKIVAKKKTVGFIYKLNPAYENSFKIGPTFLLEIDLDELVSVAPLKITNREFSKFQASSRDISVEVPQNVYYQNVIHTLVKDVKYLVGYNLIDVYQDEELLAKKKHALAISFTFNSFEEQMTEVEINHSWAQILKNVKGLGLKVR